MHYWPHLLHILTRTPKIFKVLLSTTLTNRQMSYYLFVLSSLKKSADMVCTFYSTADYLPTKCQTQIEQYLVCYYKHLLNIILHIIYTAHTGEQNYNFLGEKKQV